MNAVCAYATQHTGITREHHDELFRVEPSLYDQVGEEPLRRVSQLFYDRVYDDEQWFRTIFSASTKKEAVANQADFLVEKLGGPLCYTERKGRAHKIMSRHAPYDLTPKSAARWLEHMEAALADVPEINSSNAKLLMQYFSHMAYQLIAGKSLVSASTFHYEPR